MSRAITVPRPCGRPRIWSSRGVRSETRRWPTGRPPAGPLIGRCLSNEPLRCSAAVRRGEAAPTGATATLHPRWPRHRFGRSCQTSHRASRRAARSDAFRASWHTRGLWMGHPPHQSGLHRPRTMPRRFFVVWHERSAASPYGTGLPCLPSVPAPTPSQGRTRRTGSWPASSRAGQLPAPWPGGMGLFMQPRDPAGVTRCIAQSS